MRRQLRVTSGSMCETTSFEGPGADMAVSNGDHLRVAVYIRYLLFLGSLNERPPKAAFTLRPGSSTTVAP